jgi:hypothetical protein
LAGLSKISVQTGTSHGGVVLPDGSIAAVQLDLAALEALSKEAREQYGLGGAVQHGASTLPANAFGNFPRVGAIEIHLATNFQNIVFDHASLPADLARRMKVWLDENAQSERKPKDTDEQFYYRARKKAIGPFKRECWSLPAECGEPSRPIWKRPLPSSSSSSRCTGRQTPCGNRSVLPALTEDQLHRAGERAVDDAEAGE